MFDNAKWYELLSKLSGLDVIFTKANNQENRVKIKDGKIWVSTNDTKFKKDYVVSRRLFERVYNRLLNDVILSQTQICNDLKVHRSAFVITALSLLPEIEYIKATNSLWYRGNRNSA